MPSAAEGPNKVHHQLCGVLRTLAVAVGLLLISRQFFFNRNLWLDELFVALNLLYRSLTDLVVQQEYHQATPIGFIALEKLMMALFGNGEMALRTVPAIGGVLSLLFFSRFASRRLSPYGGALAVWLFALNFQVIYYSTEVKSYSIDLWVSVVFLDVTIGFLKSSPSECSQISRTWALLSFGFLFFSNVTALCSFAFAVVLGVRRRIGWPLLIATGAALLYHFAFRVRILQDFELQRYWEHEMFRGRWLSFEPLVWLGYKARSFAEFAFPSWNGSPLLGVPALGMGFLFRNSKDLFWPLSALCFFTWGLSLVDLYPAANRLVLFLLPAVFISFGELFNSFVQLVRLRIKPLVLGIGIVVIALGSSSWGARTWIHPHEREEILPLMQRVEREALSGDCVYFQYWTLPAFYYYEYRGVSLINSNPPVWTRSELHQLPCSNCRYQRFGGTFTLGDREKFKTDLKALANHKRVWILLAHTYWPPVPTEEADLLEEMSRVGRELLRERRAGASLYLFELRN